MHRCSKPASIWRAANLITAEEQAAASVAEFTAMGNAVDALEASLVRAEVAIEAGRPQDALTIVDEAHRAAPEEAAALEARSQVARSRALLLLGRLDEAGRAIVAGLTAARDQDLPYEEALLLRARSQWRARVDGQASTEESLSDEAEAIRLLANLGAKV